MSGTPKNSSHSIFLLHSIITSTLSSPSPSASVCLLITSKLFGKFSPPRPSHQPFNRSPLISSHTTFGENGRPKPISSFTHHLRCSVLAQFHILSTLVFAPQI
jgi:hypothetical protein